MKTIQLLDYVKIFTSPKDFFHPKIDLEKSFVVLILSILFLGLSNALAKLDFMYASFRFETEILFFGNLNLLSTYGKSAFLLMETIYGGATSFVTSGFLFWVVLKVAGVKNNKIFDTSSLFVIACSPLYFLSSITNMTRMISGVEIASELLIAMFSILAIFICVTLLKALEVRYAARGFRYYFVLSNFVIAAFLVVLKLKDLGFF